MEKDYSMFGEGLLFGLGIGLVGLWIGVGDYVLSNIFSERNLQRGYIAPSKIEIKCEDLDKDGKNETIMKIGNKPYLLREIDGSPVLLPYEIKVLTKE
jgi:hypothetical protein